MALFESNDGNTKIEVPLPVPDTLPTVLPIAFHKAGSVLLDGVIETMCEAAGRPYINIERYLFDHGLAVENFESAIARHFMASGVVYGVSRLFLDFFESEAASLARCIVLIRDPRDAVCSHYFSLRYSHFVPSEGETRERILSDRNTYLTLSLDEAVTSGVFDFLFHNMKRFGTFINLKRSNIKTYRYEDIVFDKRRWFISLSNELSISVSEATVDDLLARFDVFPTTEDPNAHVRQVKPGDYKKKLSSASVSYIENCFGDTLRLLGYAG